MMEKRQGQQEEESFYDNIGAGETDQGGGRQWSDSAVIFKGRADEICWQAAVVGWERERELEDDSKG